MKTKMNRIDCGKIMYNYPYNYFFYNYNHRSKKNEIKKAANINEDNGNSPKSNLQDLVQVNSENPQLATTEAAAAAQGSLDPFLTLQRMCSISAKVKK